MTQPDTEAATYPLLRTKLHRPPAPHDLVQRPRLLERLNQRLQRPLTLVSAPAGYGKTTLISSWLESFDLAHGWVSRLQLIPIGSNMQMLDTSIDLFAMINP